MIYGGLAGKLFFWLHCLYLYVEFEAIKNVFLGVPIPLMGIFSKNIHCNYLCYESHVSSEILSTNLAQMQNDLCCQAPGQVLVSHC